MMLSMTGFGHSEYTINKKKVSIEIKSLNSKQADINLKMPSVYRDKESEIRNLLINRLQRGKIDAFINIESLSTEENVAQLNAEAIGSYHKQLLDICKNQQIPVPDDLLGYILRMPDAVKTDRQEICDEELDLLMEHVNKTVEAADAFRRQEGAALQKDLTHRVELILSYLEEITPFEKGRIDAYKTRIHQNLSDFIGENNIDRNRFEQEIIYYLEKLDITEEKVRLHNHGMYYIKTMQEDKANGKKLGFITQEMGREINTIGSKANEVNIQQLVVRMKDELEKIKEQTLNIL